MMKVFAIVFFATSYLAAWQHNLWSTVILLGASCALLKFADSQTYHGESTQMKELTLAIDKFVTINNLVDAQKMAYHIDELIKGRIDELKRAEAALEKQKAAG